MAASTPKVVLNASRDIPLTKLVPSAANVRRIKAGVSIDQLAQDIARRGLLSSLSVRPLLNGEGTETGLFEVTGGGRRLKALEALVRQKRLPKAHPVPCILQARHGTSAEEDSLAENVMRESLHPLDQFRAFKTLRDERGLSEEEIAAAFFVTPAVVRQRLRLTAVSERLLGVYAGDEMTLEQLMAFTVSNDHARQEAVWEAVSRGYNKEPYLIRRMLTEGKVAASDRRAVLVGVEAYAAAGGVIARDLFQVDGGGWFEDPLLLDRLVDERLQAEAAGVAAEGWRWVEVARDFPYGHTQGLRRVHATVAPLTEGEAADLAALRAELERIEAEHAGDHDMPEEADRQLAELEAGIAALAERPGVYHSEEVAIGGAFVSLAYDGRVRVERGWVRPGDEPPLPATDQETAPADVDLARVPCSESEPAQASVPASGIQAGGEDPADASTRQNEEGEPGRPLPERLITELTAHRTLALREALSGDPDLAQIAVLHALALWAFYIGQGYDPASCLEIEGTSSTPGGSGTGLALSGTPAAEALARLHEAWGLQLLRKPEALWDWLLDCDPDTRASLLAYCAARTINATHQTWDRRPAAMAHATRLAGALSLDMAARWSATADTYFGRVTRAQILEAVREAKGDEAAQAIAHLKKGEMATEAERLLAGTDWLPAVLRTPGVFDARDPQPEREEPDDADSQLETAEDLPAFLTSGAEDGMGQGPAPAALVRVLAAE